MEFSRRKFVSWRLCKISSRILMLLCMLVTFNSGYSATPHENKSKIKAKRVVLLSLDGISVDAFNQAHTPNLDKLLSDGVLSLNTRIVMPSYTLPNWTSHLTGSDPELHGVVSNGWKINKIKLPALETDTEGYYPSVFKVLKDNKPGIKTAFYYNWPNLIYPYNAKYFDEVGFLENDEYVQNFEKALSFIKANKDYPTLVFLYTVHTDAAGHKYKWMSPEFLKSIEEADVQIGKFLEELEKEGLKDDTHFMFLSDHGGIDGGHGGVSVSEMIVPWGITGPGIKKGIKMQEHNNTVNTAPVILYLFGVQSPSYWTGKVPKSIFTRK